MWPSNESLIFGVTLKKQINHYVPHLIPLLFMICVLSGQLLGQQTVQRDQQALMILKQALKAAGGVDLLNSIQDFTGNGTITYFWDDQVNGNVTVRGRGTAQFRIDATLPGGERTVTVNKGVGSVTETDGTVRSIPHPSALKLGSMTFPYMPLLLATQDVSMSITYVGLVDHGGQQAQDIRIQKIYSATEDPQGDRSRLTSRDVFLDPNTSLVIGISDVIDPASGDSQGVRHEVLFSDYRTVNGMAIPFSITETVREQALFTMQLTQISFNSGLTDADFAR